MPLVEKKIEHVTVLLEVKIGEKNQFKEPLTVLDKRPSIILTDEDEKYLVLVKESLEKKKESLGRMCVRYIRPAVFASRDLFTDINLPVHTWLRLFIFIVKWIVAPTMTHS